MNKIRVDGKLIFKGELGEWISRPPAEFTDAVNPNATPEPWLKVILIAMADAVTMNQTVDITVRTKLKGVRTGWSVEVHTL